MINFDFCLVSSLIKILPELKPDQMDDKPIILFGNQHYSFQLAYTCEDTDVNGWDNRYFYMRASAKSMEAFQLYSVGLVPCDYPCHGVWDKNYLTTIPRLLPDLLTPVGWDDTFRAVPNQWRSFWVDVDAEKLPVGDTTIEIQVFSANGVELRSFQIQFKVLQQELPASTLYHTEWFHVDCLANYYKQEVFSESNWETIDSFMKSASEHGINMILTPIFTPPLDTAKNGERTTVQLVDIYDVSGSYRFDFQNLRKWVSLCKKNNITELELSHLFTQWGAIAAPKIMVHTENGIEKRFGWHTPATSEEYVRFLSIFLPKLKEELNQLVGLEHVWFHISDEPNDENKSTYAAAQAIVSPLLEGCKIIDALSSYNLYHEGFIKKPVVSIDHIQTFVDHGLNNLWGYYCTAQAVDVPNRFIAMPSTRNRILGVLLYVYGIEGFLHWGFNFYNSQYSIKNIDPFRITDCCDTFPSGDAFLVYPGPEGSPLNSIRGEVLKQAQLDLRLLNLCESKIGRKSTLELLQKIAGAITFTNYPTDIDFFETLWNSILKKI